MTPFNAPAIDGMQYTAEDTLWARCRPLARRTVLPAVGARVGYRKDAHGPIIPATVVSVDLGNRADPNVWRYRVLDPTKGPELDELGQRVMELVDDPWPDVVLHLDGMPGVHPTREARLPGSPGWLPMTEG